MSALAHGLGSWSVGLGPRCGLRAETRMRTGRALALGGAARSGTAHHNSDSPSRRSVRSTSDQNCGFSRRATRVALRAEASGGILTRIPRACAYASGADRAPHHHRDAGGAFELPSGCLVRALAKHAKFCTSKVRKYAYINPEGFASLFSLSRRAGTSAFFAYLRLAKK